MKKYHIFIKIIFETMKILKIDNKSSELNIIFYEKYDIADI